MCEGQGIRRGGETPRRVDRQKILGICREVVGMGRDLEGNAFSRKWSLLSRCWSHWAQRRKLRVECARGPPQVPGRGIEDGIVLGKTWGPAGGLVETTRVLLGRLEQRTRESGRCGRSGSPLWSWRPSVWITKARGEVVSICGGCNACLARERRWAIRGQTIPGCLIVATHSSFDLCV